MAGNGKTIKIKKRHSFNVGLVILAVIFFYVVVSVIIYASSKKSIVYEVYAGSLAVDNVYTALIERDETIYTSEYSGTINTYLGDEARVGYQTVVYSVDEAGRVSEKIAEMSERELDSDELLTVSNVLNDYSLQSSSVDFSSLYSLHQSIDSTLNELHTDIVLEDLEELIS